MRLEQNSSGTADRLFEGIPSDFTSWMSHGDSVEKTGSGYKEIAQSENGVIAAAAHKEKPFWGVQFHPEISHCEYGEKILENFACGICGAQKQWSLEQYIELESRRIAEQAGSFEVLLLISGGVDSTVAAGLLLKALDPEKVWLMYIDTGLMRRGETAEVEKNLKTLGARHLLTVNAEERFLSALKGISDPEEKRKVIGDTFIRVQEKRPMLLKATTMWEHLL